MIRTNLLITFTALIVSGCNHSDNKTMMAQTATHNETKQDSTSGYATVNGLKMYYERDVARMQSFPDISEEQMKSIQAPALIIIGDADVVTPEHAAEMHRLLSHARLAIIPGGHGDYIGEIITLKTHF